MRPVRFLGDSLKCCETFPRAHVTTQVTNLIRSREATSRTTSSHCPPSARVLKRFAFCNRAAPRRADVVYVLHAFHKKTQRTPKKDLEIAKRRFGQLLGGRI